MLFRKDHLNHFVGFGSDLVLPQEGRKFSGEDINCLGHSLSTLAVLLNDLSLSPSLCPPFSHPFHILFSFALPFYLSPLPTYCRQGIWCLEVTGFQPPLPGFSGWARQQPPSMGFLYSRYCLKNTALDTQSEVWLSPLLAISLATCFCLSSSQPFRFDPFSLVASDNKGLVSFQTGLPLPLCSSNYALGMWAIIWMDGSSTCLSPALGVRPGQLLRKPWRPEIFEWCVVHSEGVCPSFSDLRWSPWWCETVFRGPPVGLSHLCRGNEASVELHSPEPSRMVKKWVLVSCLANFCYCLPLAPIGAPV